MFERRSTFQASRESLVNTWSMLGPTAFVGLEHLAPSSSQHPLPQRNTLPWIVGADFKSLGPFNRDLPFPIFPTPRPGLCREVQRRVRLPYFTRTLHSAYSLCLLSILVGPQYIQEIVLHRSARSHFVLHQLESFLAKGPAAAQKYC